MGAKLASSCCTAAEPEEVVLAPEYHTDFLGKPLFYNEDSLLDHTVDINNAKPQAKWQGQKEVKKDHSNFDYPAFCCKAKGPGVLAEEADDEGAAGERLQRGKHLQQDWNSREFLRELNRQARSLSMEFKPFQHSFR
mmetsp:Transcript_18678/g.26260  ORF Transcript_18678/g.26260 Transcript_18678/m.26260 type:complete len:137 (-) Transcript_18678:52-462(-)